MTMANQVHHLRRPRDRRARQVRFGFLAYFLWIIPASMAPLQLTDLPRPHILIGVTGGARPCNYAGMSGTVESIAQGGTCPWVLFIAGE
jgi:hypothetical protein